MVEGEARDRFNLSTGKMKGVGKREGMLDGQENRQHNKALEAEASGRESRSVVRSFTRQTA
jgi:hypothetical protein